ncbi:MAG: hypothetical protein SGARI_004287 [Bacillariaceae sp.]
MSEQESGSSGGSINEERIEQLLSEKLMTGYVLMEHSCPVCSTPLVKNNHMPDGSKSDDSSASINSKGRKGVIIGSDSFDKPFKPVAGVPLCVVCRAHVVTNESEISILEHCESLKDKGSILLALEDSTVDDSRYTETSDVIISVASNEKHGEDNEVEVVSSPRAGDVEKPIFVDDKTLNKDRADTFDDTTVEGPSIIQTKTDVNDVMEEYSVR